MKNSNRKNNNEHTIKTSSQCKENIDTTAQLKYITNINNCNNIKKHALKSQFTSNLTGKFYKNNSLESHQKHQRTVERLNKKQQSLIHEIRNKENQYKSLQNTFIQRYNKRVLLIKDIKQRYDIFLHGLILLQSRMRCKIDYQRYQHVKQCCIVIQSYVRMKITLNVFQSFKKKTIQIIMQIQSWYRGCNERCHKIRILRQEYKQTQEIKVKACVIIQSKFYKRCIVCKQQILYDTIIPEIMQRLEEERIQQMIQQEIRRKQMVAKRVLRHFIQKVVKRTRHRKKKIRLFRQEQKRVSASIKIQSCIRSLLCRRRFRALRLRLQLLINHKPTTKRLFYHKNHNLNESLNNRPVFVVGVSKKKRPMSLSTSPSLIHNTLHHYRKKCMRNNVRNGAKSEKTSDTRIREQVTSHATRDNNHHKAIFKKNPNDNNDNDKNCDHDKEDEKNNNNNNKENDNNESNIQNNDDPYEIARLRAAKRVAKVENYNRKIKEFKKIEANNIANRIKQLEYKRRKLYLREIQLREKAKN